MKSIYNLCRPTALDDLVGQSELVKSLKRKHKANSIPTAIALTGPSGCGKSTVAYILRKLLKCVGSDFTVVECGKEGGIDTIRDITRSQMNLMPKGENLIFLLEEGHKLTDAAQQSLLVPTEHPPDNVYWIISTTDYVKIIPALKNRFIEFRLKPLNDDDMLNGVLKPAIKRLSAKIDSSVLTKIIECSEGSPRRALRFLEKVIDLDQVQEQLDEVQPEAVRKVKILLWGRPEWSKAAEVLKYTTEEPEMVRRMVMAVAGTELLKCNKNTDRAAGIIKTFQYQCDTGKAGYSQLLTMAYDCCPKRK